MEKQRTHPVQNALERFSGKVTEGVGSSLAFTIAVAVVLVWGITGPLFHFSDTWQLVINTGTTIITFLMVFLIQRAQNKEARAMQLKLDEIVLAIKGASNRLVDVEQLPEEELRHLQKHYQELADRLKSEGDPRTASTVETAANRSGQAAERRRASR
jgi:low affinity Fe/Cu permease